MIPLFQPTTSFLNPIHFTSLTENEPGMFACQAWTTSPFSFRTTQPKATLPASSNFAVSTLTLNQPAFGQHQTAAPSSLFSWREETPCNRPLAFFHGNNFWLAELTISEAELDSFCQILQFLFDHNLQHTMAISSQTSCSLSAMKESWVYIISTSLAILYLLKLTLSKRTACKNLPPGPPKLPIIGHIHLMKKPIHRSLQHLSNKYGPILFLSFGSQPVIVISSPSLLEECFTQHDIIFANRPRRVDGKYLHYDFTTIGAADYGDHWRNLRRLATVEIFSTARLHLFHGIRQEEARLLVKNLFRNSGQVSTKVEMRSRLTDLSFNIIMRMVAGKRYFGLLVENTEEAKIFYDVVKEISELSGAANLGDIFPILRWFDYQTEKRLVATRKNMDLLFDCLIDEHRPNKDSCQEKKSNMTMIDVILSLQESKPEHYSDEIIKGLIMIMLAAGTDTVAVTIEWALSLLLNHPEALNKARAELDIHVGRDRLVDESDLSKLQYLQGIINETLRLYPPAPLLVPHKSSGDCKIGGYDVQQGTVLFVNVWALHRDPKVWEDPNSFKPERFKGLKDTSYRLVPFGLGRRSCPGYVLANKVVGLALAALIQCFDWERITEEELNMLEGTGLTMPKVQPLEAICKTREAMMNILLQL